MTTGFWWRCVGTGERRAGEVVVARWPQHIPLARLVEEVLRCAAGRPLPVTRLRTGRPWADGGWCVSASRSGGWAVALAAAADCCGVDLERVRPVPDAASIAGRHFHPDERRLLHRHARAGSGRLFMVLWTRREALLKCLGTGLADEATRLSTLSSGPFRVDSWLLDHAGNVLALSSCLPAAASAPSLRWLRAAPLR